MKGYDMFVAAKFLTLLAVILIMCGCVMPGDIEALRLGQIKFQSKQFAAFNELKIKSETVTTKVELEAAKKQFVDYSKEAKEEFDDLVAEKVAVSQQRMEVVMSVMQAAIGTIQGTVAKIEDEGISTTQGVAGLGGGLATLGVILNMYRNNTRKQAIGSLEPNK